MKQFFSDMKDAVGTSVIVVVVLAIIALGILAINGTIYPWWLSIQRQAVEQSKSFSDANNNMLQTYILEYSELDTKIAEADGNPALIPAYKAQQKAIVTKMCRQISTMSRNTVDPSTITWLNNKGGCK